MPANFKFDPDLFADELDQPAPAPIAARVMTPVVRQTATVTSRTRENRKDYLTRAPESWTWEDVRNYVVSKIQEIHGDFPRHEGKEFGTFSGFAGRHGEMAGPIAVFAFETQPTPGYWKGSPISTTRFCKNSDPYFSDLIKARLTQA